MIALFRSALDCVKALFVAEATLDFEAEMIARNASRKAELLRQASEYERDGLPQVAEEMRSLADRICLREPLAGVIPSIEHWVRHARPTPMPAVGPAKADSSTQRMLPAPPPIIKKRK